MPTERLGAVYGASAYLLWGVLALYWPLLQPAGAIEVLAHRIVWSLVFVAGILLAKRHWAWVRDVGRNPRAVGALVVAAVIISVNWTTYIWAVSNGHVVETSLGYFINPIVTVTLGVLVLGERLRPAQWVAVGVASVAVLVLTVNYGRLPWVALTLAFSFAAYGLLKKVARVGAVESLTIETAVLFVPALGWLLLLERGGEGSFGHYGLGDALLLAGAGVVTAVPLLFFGAAARRVPLSVLGVLQYLAPTIQFLLGVFVFAEPMPAVRLAGFALVWTALAIFTAESLASRRRQLRVAAEAVNQPGEPPTRVM